MRRTLAQCHVALAAAIALFGVAGVALADCVDGVRNATPAELGFAARAEAALAASPTAQSTSAATSTEPAQVQNEESKKTEVPVPTAKDAANAVNKLKGLLGREALRSERC